MSKICLPSPWPPGAYRSELGRPEEARYRVARVSGRRHGGSIQSKLDHPNSPDDPDVLDDLDDSNKPEYPGDPNLPGDQKYPSIARLERADQAMMGFAGLNLLYDEIHICMLAVHPDYRRLGLGQLLVLDLIEIGARMGGALATLEVRESNQAAQALYGRLGFKEVGRRIRYYKDSGEDALILTRTDLSQNRPRSS